VLDEVQRWHRLRAGWRDAIRGLTGASKRPSGRDSILAYISLFVGTDVRREELMVVSGIAEYARRIRELRVQEGYDIVSGTSDRESGVAHGSYRLFSVIPNSESAARWKQASRIRRQAGSQESRILALLRENVGVPLTTEMLQYVGKKRSARERVRDLRLTEGWRIASKRNGRPDLRNDQWVLTTDERLPEHDRDIADETYEAVLTRDRYRCRRCNWSPSDGLGGLRHSLEVHHIEHHAHGGSNEPKNLLTLCDLDHDDAHSKKIDGHVKTNSWLAKRPDYYIHEAHRS
jgi:hypothetical protein